jgi:DNA uptake protein ComE-like DNA-binding protein
MIVAPVLAAASTLAAAQTPSQSQSAAPPPSSVKEGAPSATATKPASKPATQGPQAESAKAPTGMSTSQGGTGTATLKAAGTPAAPLKKVDLNNASLEELKTLPTVGDAEAKQIIAHRPYKSKGELVTKAGLPEGVYHAVKRKVELQTPRKPAPKK